MPRRAQLPDDEWPVDRVREHVWLMRRAQPNDAVEKTALARLLNVTPRAVTTWLERHGLKDLGDLLDAYDTQSGADRRSRWHQESVRRLHEVNQQRREVRRQDPELRRAGEEEAAKWAERHSRGDQT